MLYRDSDSYIQTRPYLKLPASAHWEVSCATPVLFLVTCVKKYILNYQQISLSIILLSDVLAKICKAVFPVATSKTKEQKYEFRN